MRHLSIFFFFFLMIRRPPRSTLFPTRRSSDLGSSEIIALRHSYHGRSSLAMGITGQGNWRVGPSPVTNGHGDRKSTRLNSSHTVISYAVFCLKKKKD